MLPYVNIFGKVFSTYSLCTLVGIFFFALLFWILHRNDKNLDSVQKLNAPIIAAFGAFLGAHILYGVTQTQHILWVVSHLNAVFTNFNTFAFYMSSIFGGMVFYGGLLGGLTAGAIYCKAMKLDPLVYGDAYAPCIPLFHAFGRLGCFLTGCCYGVENSWGVVYESSAVESANGVTRLPIQLIEAGGNILICIVLTIIFLKFKNIKKGMLLCLYFYMYSVLRFIDEFFRGDDIRGKLFGLSTSQWISAALFIFAVCMTAHIYLKDNKSPKVEATV